jgi:hypothetical protein
MSPPSRSHREDLINLPSTDEPWCTTRGLYRRRVFTKKPPESKAEPQIELTVTKGEELETLLALQLTHRETHPEEDEPPRVV